MIQVGDKLPDATFLVPTDDGPQERTTQDLFGGKKAVLFAVPGAYTPTCHQNHMPGYVKNLDALKAKGVDLVACVAVNDIFVLDHWAKDTGAYGKIEMLADGSAAFTKKIGLEIDLTERGLGVRSHRYAMILEDGVVKHLGVEDGPPAVDVSSAEAILAKL